MIFSAKTPSQDSVTFGHGTAAFGLRSPTADPYHGAITNFQQRPPTNRAVRGRFDHRHITEATPGNGTARNGPGKKIPGHRDVSSTRRLTTAPVPVLFGSAQSDGTGLGDHGNGMVFAPSWTQMSSFGASPRAGAHMSYKGRPRRAVRRHRIRHSRREIRRHVGADGKRGALRQDYSTGNSLAALHRPRQQGGPHRAARRASFIRARIRPTNRSAILGSTPNRASPRVQGCLRLAVSQSNPHRSPRAGTTRNFSTSVDFTRGRRNRHPLARSVVIPSFLFAPAKQHHSWFKFLLT